MNRNLLVGALLFAGTVLTGCAGGSFVVATGPPAPRYGVVGVAPGPGYMWTEGFYDLRGSNWVWVPGAWRRPPRAGRVWVTPAWSHEGNRWRFHRGHWR
ncbi:MAG TPA: hypothetical protein VHW24_11155 [Bryobacteraceae bacterium]|jgi:hypothetical protein|nr:hypothetical protein [Bryobacteraceae bacterium]